MAVEHWEALVSPYLTSLAQSAHRNLDSHEALDNPKVKAIILGHTTISLDT